MKYWNMVIKFFDQVIIFTAIITVIKLKYSGKRRVFRLPTAEISRRLKNAGGKVLNW